MSVSFSENWELTCPDCGTRSRALIWTIVDSSEQPEVWERCRTLEINMVRCPLGHTDLVQGPLLLHDASAGRLIYSPSPVANPQEIQSSLGSVMSKLRGSPSSSELSRPKKKLTT